MNEALLQFIWQYSLYRFSDIRTEAGEALTILHCGKLNKDAGPDFAAAKIKIDNTILVGNIELHVKASDWLRHGHQDDDAYKNLILHVVYENDVPDAAGNTPVLEMRNLISQQVISRYTGLVQAPQKLCRYAGTAMVSKKQ